MPSANLALRRTVCSPTPSSAACFSAVGFIPGRPFWPGGSLVANLPFPSKYRLSVPGAAPLNTHFGPAASYTYLDGIHSKQLDFGLNSLLAKWPLHKLWNS